MTIYITGSIAYDRIMRFPGVFGDHILPHKIHALNVCFLIDSVDERLGGCGGNIAHTLALLGEKPVIVAAVGRDFDHYREALEAKGLSLEQVRRVPEEFTASCHIITDQENNQITCFNPGAMRHACDYAFADAGPGDWAIVSPTNGGDMQAHTRIHKEKGVRCIFDPGQQIPALSGSRLAEAITGADLLICNEYELELICKSTGKTHAQLRSLTPAIITTLGAEGSRLEENGKETRIGAVPPKLVADPTGAGDAYRGGLLKGLVSGLPLVEAAAMGATAASYCVECLGTQAHSYTIEEFQARHSEFFG